MKDNISSYLSVNEPFTKERVRSYFLERGEELSEDNLRVRINRLKSKGTIINVGRGLYRLNNKKGFEHEITPILKRVSSRIKKGFPFLNYIVWSSNWLNDLATLQLMRNVIVIEVEAGSEEAVFRTIKEDFPTKTFLNPKENERENYMYESENIIIKTMISESPSVNSHSIKTARLEKILIDLFCDKFWRAMFAGELHNMYTEACSNYSLNYTTMLSYAARRGKKEEVWDYIKSLGVLEVSTIEMVEK